ncbi:MAG: AAA family ATPase [Candidatus Altiarchaeales archaeon]|nr:AAA family ATPase [Candidatus Altiarchaeales archaeon]
MLLDEIETTEEIQIPKDPLDRVIGQTPAVEKVKIAIKQHRHLLLVGPPGTGKSMIANAVASHIKKPTQQVTIAQDPDNPHKPKIDVLSETSLRERQNALGQAQGRVVSSADVPSFVAERMGYRCSHCGRVSDPRFAVCPECGGKKSSRVVRGFDSHPVRSVVTDVFELGSTKPEQEVQTTRINAEGNQETIIYQRVDGERIRVLNQSALNELRRLKKTQKTRVLLSINRNVFVQATGASETELLGDVRHDPYGSHPEIGTPAYMRVVPGAIHEAHEGVLFVDELPRMGALQGFILTAMQNKKFTISGRNPHSSGAMVRVEDMPCDFLFIGACNIKDVQNILSPLRSRIAGNGYEILLESTMEDNVENQEALARFVTQEISLDKKIPPATCEVVWGIIGEARRRALVFDDKRDALTLRLRDLAGVIRHAGDLAALEEAALIEQRHLSKSLSEAKSIEKQLKDRYGSLWKGLDKDDSVLVGDVADGRGYG